MSKRNLTSILGVCRKCGTGNTPVSNDHVCLDCYEPVVADYDKINPPHYKRGPVVLLGECNRFGYLTNGVTGHDTFEQNGRKWLPLHCIDVFRFIKDPRLATALRYIWRVAFGGKIDEDPKTCIRKAIWYLNDYCDNTVDPSLTTSSAVDTVSGLGYDSQIAQYAADDGVTYPNE